jgi:hypothetical protein
MMEGFSEHWPAILTALIALIGSGGLGVMMKTWLDHRRGVRKQTDDVAMSLVQQLKERVATVESEALRERVLCDAKLGIQRHRVNNLSSSFDSMLMLMELAPEKAPEMVKLVKERRAQQEQSEAIEKAALAGIATNMSGQLTAAEELEE